MNPLEQAGRACAASMMGKPNDAEEYAHEAIEHGALSGDMHLLQAVKVEDLLAKPWNKDYRWVAEDQSKARVTQRALRRRRLAQA